METPNTIFEFIENQHFRTRASMYLRGDRVLDLVKFLDGFSLCEQVNKVDSGVDEFFNNLTLLVREELIKVSPEHQNNNYHWYQMIEVIAKARKVGELSVFFDLYDKLKSNYTLD